MATEHTKHQVESKERQGVAYDWTRVISLAYYYYYCYYYCWRDFDIHCFYHDRFNTGLHFVYMHYYCIDEDLFTTWCDMHVCVRIRRNFQRFGSQDTAVYTDLQEKQVYIIIIIMQNQNSYCIVCRSVSDILKNCIFYSVVADYKQFILAVVVVRRRGHFVSHPLCPCLEE